MRILLLSKRDNAFCSYAEFLLHSYFSEDDAHSVRGVREEPLDETLGWLRPDYLISFLSPWILPDTLLRCARNRAINFHPGPPEYPGTGCYNFALYNGERTYGVTCHEMLAKVDSGTILMTSRFQVAAFESVESLKLKSMNHLLLLFDKVLACIAGGDELPCSGEQWKRKPYTRKEMLELFTIRPEYDREEIARRVRAADYPSSAGARVSIQGVEFFVPGNGREPIV